MLAHACVENGTLSQGIIPPMPKPRIKFPYWDLAREIEAVEGISLPEAVQRVVESAVEDAVDQHLGHREKDFRSLRSTKATRTSVRRLYQKHHPRVKNYPSPEVAPQQPNQPKEPEQIAAPIADEQLQNLARYWPQSAPRRTRKLHRSD